jgi:hypothetical protein
MSDASIPWLSLLLLGAAHGINPAMGWLFAVGRGLQAGNRRALWRALGPLALGHALAIGAAIALTIVVGRVLPLGWMRWVVAASLLAVGLDGLMHHRHVKLRGMLANGRELATWSFLMANAHGAGLMVLPFVFRPTLAPATSSMMDHQHMMELGGAAGTPPLEAGLSGLGSVAITAPLVHTLGYLVVTIVLAVVVYEKVGLRMLRKAWINVNAIWSVALIAAAAFAVLN